MSEVYETLIARAPGPDVRRTVRVLVAGASHVTAIAPVGRFVVGRGADAQVHVSDATVSRRHAELVLEGDRISLVDLNSANGTRIGDRPVSADGGTPLRLGELFTVGDVLGVVYDGALAARPSQSVGRDEIGELITAAAAGSRDERPFSVCTLTWPGAAHRLDAVAAMAPPRGHVAAISENVVVVFMPRTTRADAEAWLGAMSAYFARTGAELSSRLTSCPDDGDTLARLCPQALPSDATAARPVSAALFSAPITMPDAATAQAVPSAAMQKVHELVEQVAATPTSILILGETGVGKEVLARSVHERSNRKGAPFVALNCAALPETLLESELFGYEKGAFTGANTAKPGLIEAASGGTLFLDELGEMPLSTQAKLLRVLEERAVLRVGAVKPKSVDIRLVAATNRDLLEEIQAKRFRPDLYYRLNSIILRLPPLRERRAEIRPLAGSFAAKAAEALGRPTPRFPDDVYALLDRYSWPGNVRELRNAVERLVLLAQGGVASAEHLPEEIRAQLLASPAARIPLDTVLAVDERAPTAARHTFRPDPVEDPKAPPSSKAPSSSLEDEIARLEKTRIVDALEKCAGNQTRAAELLGITRRVLIGKMEKYGMPRPRK